MALAMAEIRKRLSAFSKTFTNAKNEQQQASVFWTRFYDCYGIKAETATIYEQQVSKLSGAKGRIDSFIPGKLIVEHKSKGKDLQKAYEQAQEYYLALPEEERPRYIITSDFAHLHLYDLRAKKSYECALADLSKRAGWFKFLIEEDSDEIVEETPINRNAAYAISRLHEELLRINFKGRDLEVFLTRLLFCLFADDTAIFGDNGQFRKFVEATKPDGTDLGSRLTDLFGVLDKPIRDRQKTLDESLASFAYINGDLFKARGDIPAFNSELREHLLECAALDWSGISPAIFGAMFQGVLEEHSPDASRQSTRRELGAHYTSERNILRVINPLFMDGLRAELEAARRSKPRLEALYNKLPSLTFLDPACGCGNFLVIAYREVRRLENEVIADLFNLERGKGVLDISTLCRVRVNQFYGIEIDEAAAHIARVAMWITDHQLNLEAAARFGSTRPTIPLVDSPHIICANALTTNWNQLLPADRCSFVFGNPPFVGAKYMTNEQRQDVALITGKMNGGGLLDLVACWHILAARYIALNPQILVSFVSTSSICQGEQVGALWSFLLAAGIRINFAHRTFQWTNDAKGVAAVHCVIVGYGKTDTPKKRIFDYSGNLKGDAREFTAKNINPYLVDAPDIVLMRRNTPICAVPEIGIGNKPIDDGQYLFSKDTMNEFIAREPSAARYFRPWVGSDEFINGLERWCLWLGDAQPSELRAMPTVMRRVEAVRAFRLASKSAPTQKLAAMPTRFHVEFIPTAPFLVIPKVSSERREFVPIGFLTPDVFVSDLCFAVPNATLFHFGVLSSTAHNAWMRAVCGRLESRYRYSAGIVYNNFPWSMDPTEAQRSAIQVAAEKVLQARASFSSSTLADLYDPNTMPPMLSKAHQDLDRAVDAAYGYKGSKDDASRVSFLFGLYHKYTSLLPEQPSRKTKKHHRTT